jgi:tetratricopeptide (TPR) repeat protein
LALVTATSAACASGCASFVAAPQSAALLRAPPPSLPQRAEITAVPFFPQTPFHCGPAALATVLVHAGFAVTPEALAEGVFLPARQGALQDEMLASARRSGALAVPIAPDLTSLCLELAAGHAVVLLQNLGLAIAPRWHYAVAVGYDLPQANIILRSGTTQREVMALPLFERTWARSHQWAFVALRPHQLPATASEADAVQAAVAFERVATAAQALTAYQAVSARWPSNLVALLGVGNAHATLGDAPRAAATFEAAALRHDSAAAWHNLGVMRSRMNDRAGAAQAAQRALARAQAAEPAWVPRAQRLIESLRP